MTVALVYVTFPEPEQARSIAREMIEQRLAACVTFWPAGSMYWWEGEIETTEETLALFKTHEGRVHELTRRLSDAHPHDVPCVLPWPTFQPLEAYEAWVRKEATGAGASPA